jgi:L-asparaginase
MNKILLIYTGGTIAGKTNYKNVITLNQEKDCILEMCEEKYGLNDFEFVSCEPYKIFSENLNITYFEKIISKLREYDLKEFDGIILFHGTDTLSYTSNFLGLYLGNLGIPFVMVSSNYELSDPRSNGLYNFKAALDFIKYKISGVFVSYRQDNINYIHLGTRILQCTHFNNNFYSYENVYFGYIEEGKLILNEDKRNIKISDISSKKSMFNDNIKIKMKNNVRLFKPDISIDYSNIKVDNIAAIIHSTYHSGTINLSEDKRFSVLTLLKKCNDKNIPFFIAPITQEQKTHTYETLDNGMKKGIIPLLDISLEAVYCKTLILVQIYTNDVENLKEAMESDIFFEKL